MNAGTRPAFDTAHPDADAAGIVMLGTDAPIIPEGRAWAKAEQGEPGEIGASAYELWLTECNSGEKADFFSDLGTSALATMYQSPPGTATDNANVYGFGMVMKYRGQVRSLSTQCRMGGNAAPANTEIPAKVWKKDSCGKKTLLATSTNYQQYSVGDTMRWVFDPFEVERGNMLLVTFHTRGCSAPIRKTLHKKPPLVEPRRRLFVLCVTYYFAY